MLRIPEQYLKMRIANLIMDTFFKFYRVIAIIRIVIVTKFILLSHYDFVFDTSNPFVKTIDL